MKSRLLFFALLLATPLSAADAPPNEKMLRAVQAEVERRKALRQKAEQEQAANEANARRLIREETSGLKQVSPQELAAAREIVRQAEVNKPRVGPPRDPNEKVMMRMADVDMATWAAAWQLYFGQPVTVADRVKTKCASLRIVVPTPIKDVKPQMVSALRQAGVYVVESPDETRFDLEPAPPAAPAPRTAPAKSSE